MSIQQVRVELVWAYRDRDKSLVRYLTSLLSLLEKGCVS